MWQKLNRCYPFRLELVPLGLLLLTLYLAVSAYAILPPTIPTHFNIRGVPDSWGSKNEIFVYSILNAFIYLLFTFFNVWLALTDNPRRLISLSQVRKAVLTDDQAEELRIFLNHYLFLLTVLIQGLNAYALYVTIEVALGKATNLGALWFGFIAVILVVAGVMVGKSLVITRTSR